MIERPLTEQITALRSGETTPAELWAATREQITALDPTLSTYLEIAPEPEWPEGTTNSLLAGAPIAVKANLAVHGLAHSAGIGALADRTAEADAAAVQLLRAGGGTIVGTTNMAEGAVGSVSNNPHFGSARNPRDRTRTAGGSSGGSAAAVAAAMASGALGSDTMGSVRIPAAYCGVVGLKPSRGLVPTGGLVPLSDLLDTVGPLGRTVGDVMTLFSVLTGSRVPSPAALEGVRIGILELAVEIDPTVEEAVRGMIDLVASRAGAMRRVPLELDFRRVRLAGLLDVEAGGSAYLEEVLTTHPEGFSEHFRSMLEFASTKTAVDLVKSQRLLAQVSRQIEPLFEDVDVLMCATVGRFPDRIEDGEVADAADICAFANAAGIPAVSIPIATSSSLPTGLQLIGPRGSDATLLSVAAGVEKLTGWDPTVAVNGT